MTFDECYKQVILPSYEELKEEWELSEGNRGEIETLGSAHRLTLSTKTASRSWKLMASISEEERGRLRIDGWYSLNGTGEQLSPKTMRIEELTLSGIRGAIDVLKNMLEEMKRKQRIA